MSDYFHGGVRQLKVGQQILPPKNTGEPSTAASGDYPVGTEPRLDRVFMVADLDAARLYALLYRKGRGWVYRVEPSGELEPDNDWLGEPGVSVCAPRANVLEVVERNVVQLGGFSATEVMRKIGVAA